MLYNYTQFVKEGLFDDFGDFEIEDHGKVVKTYRNVKNFEVECWRGFDYPTLEELENNNFILNPSETQDNMLWFTSRLCNISDPFEYASDRDTKYFLTYPLTIKIHEDVKEYEDGHKDTSIPMEILDISNTTEDSSFYGKYELPDGWFFSYKTQKFLVCKKPLKVDKNMIETR